MKKYFSPSISDARRNYSTCAVHIVIDAHGGTISFETISQAEVWHEDNREGTTA